MRMNAMDVMSSQEGTARHGSTPNRSSMRPGEAWIQWRGGGRVRCQPLHGSPWSRSRVTADRTQT